MNNVLNARIMWLAAACIAPTLGCDAGGADADAAFGAGGVTERSVHGNDLHLNSANLNGRSLNGLALNGRSLNGRSLNGRSLNGRSLNGLALIGSSFAADQVIDGQTVSLAGEALIGSELELTVDGDPFLLRFDDIYKDPADPAGDVYFNDISVHDPVTDTWSSLCLDATGAPTQAIVIANYWDLTTGDRIDDADAVTFACRGAALAKCVEWGYHPWADHAGVSLADHHQACTRMVRADYCGSGVPNTLNNTPIDVYDRLAQHIQAQASVGEKEWKVEAEWGPDGALCMTKETRLKLFEHTAHTDPQCRDALQKVKECGKFPSKRPQSKLGTSYCPKWQTDPGKCVLENDDD